MTGRSLSLTDQLKTTPHPLRNLADFNNQNFPTAVNAILGDPAAELSVPVSDLIDIAGWDHLNNYIRAKAAANHSSNFTLGPFIFSTVALGKGVAGLGQAAKGLYGVHKHASDIRRTNANITEFIYRRPVLTLTDRDRQLISTVADLTARWLYPADDWRRFLALMVYHGNIPPEPTPRFSADKHLPELLDHLNTVLSVRLPNQATFHADTLAQIARIARQPYSDPALAQIFSPGARWMTPQDLAASQIYTTEKRPKGLLLGYHPQSGEPVYFETNESIFTAGGPNSGKSQTLIIPNLLNYPGSAIVLDVKGELWDLTAGWRAKNFGPVYRFAPTDPANTHRYNPFDFIPDGDDLDTMANECTVFSHQVVAASANSHDPFWENRARDMMWAYAVMIALKADPEDRNMQGLAELMATPPEAPTKNNPDKTPIMILAESMLRNGIKTGIKELSATASTILAGLKDTKRFESIMDNAKRHLTLFNRAPSLGKIMEISDWHPMDFKTNPGSTLYICLSGDELEAFGPLVRVLLTQHARILMRDQSPPDALPVTFFLDEMPQLGNFQSILKMQDVGRGAGIRLWMMTQYIGQLSAAVGEQKYRGVISACVPRLFLQPDNEAANLIASGLENTRDLMTGAEKPLATPPELMGAKYRDQVIMTTRAGIPAILDKRWAYKTESAKFLPPPPIIRKPIQITP
jgi:type IV secretion system protein VirD4